MSSSCILRSIALMISTLRPALLGTDLTTMSLGRIISFSSTYCLMSLMKGSPYLVAFPVPTPTICVSSSIVIGYCMAISSSEGSWKMTKGGRFSFFEMALRRSFSIENKVVSVPLPFGPPALAASSSSSSWPSYLWSLASMMVKGFFK